MNIPQHHSHIVAQQINDSTMSNRITGKVFGGAGAERSVGLNDDHMEDKHPAPGVVLNWSKTSAIDLSSLQENHARLGAEIILQNRKNNGRKIDTRNIGPKNRNPLKLNNQASSEHKHPTTTALPKKYLPRNGAFVPEKKSNQRHRPNVQAHLKLRPAKSELTLASAKWLSEEKLKVNKLL